MAATTTKEDFEPIARIFKTVLDGGDTTFTLSAPFRKIVSASVTSGATGNTNVSVHISGTSVVVTGCTANDTLHTRVEGKGG